MYQIHYVLITCVTPVCVYVSNTISTHYLSYLLCVYFYLFPSMRVSCATPVCVCACFQLTTPYLYVYMYLIQSVHSISAALVCVCTHVHMDIYH